MRPTRMILGFVAVRVKEGHSVPAGVYFRVELAGITGHQQFARDAGIVVRPSECVAVGAAIIRVFNEHGNRTNRKKARLKYLIDDWGIEKFMHHVEEKLAFPLTSLPKSECMSRHPVVLHGHIGVYKQAQPGKNYIGVAIPVGRMKCRQMCRLADLAENYGSGDLRLTVWQNLVLPGISDAFLETVKRNLVRLGFHYQAGSLAGGLIACTGNTGCKWSSTNTKGHAVELVRTLERKLALDLPINIHLTGCPNSCAQHYMGDIGLLGVKLGPNAVEGYHVFVGGGFGETQGIGREIFHGIPFADLPPLLEGALRVYLARRRRGEAFVDFTRRHELKELQEMFSE